MIELVSQTARNSRQFTAYDIRYTFLLMNTAETDSHNSKLPQVPGHWLLGSLLEFKRALHELLQKAGTYGDGLVQFWLLHKHMIAITTPEAAEHVFKISNKSFPRGKHRKALRRVLGLGLITQQGAL